MGCWVLLWCGAFFDCLGAVMICYVIEEVSIILGFLVGVIGVVFVEVEVYWFY